MATYFKSKHRFAFLMDFKAEPEYSSAEHPELEKYWGPKKLKYTPVKIVQVNIIDGYTSDYVLSRGLVAYYSGSAIYTNRLLPENVSFSKNAKEVGGEWLTNEDILCDPPLLANLIPGTTSEIYYRDDVGYAFRYFQAGSVIEPIIESGYEFYGWRYFELNKYYGKDSDSKNVSVILKPTSTFNGDIEVLDEKKGRIKILKPEIVNDVSGATYEYGFYLLIPIIKYIQRTIIYKTCDGAEDTTDICKGTTPVVLPKIEKVGYYDAKWYSKDTFEDEYYVGEGEASYYPPSDITLYAKWIPKKYTVIFDAADGIVSQVTKEVEFDNIYNILPIPIKSGYVFDGWYLGDEKITDITKVTTAEDHTLVAKWIGGKFTVTKKDFAGSADVSGIGKLKLYSSKDNYLSPIAEEADGKITYEGPTNVVYKLVLELAESGEDFSWSALGVNSAGQYVSSYSFSVPPGGELDIVYVLKAKNFFRVTLDYDATLGNAYILSPSSPDKDDKYVEGREIVIGYNANEGCRLTFAKYFNSDGSLIGGEDSPNGKNLTFTLKYDTKIVLTFDKIKCKVDVEVDEPSKDAIESVTGEVEGIDYGSEVHLSATVQDGYYFDGWYLDGSLISSDSSTTVKVTDNCLYIAKAKVKVSFAVEYQDNRDDTSIPVDENCTLLINGIATTFPFETFIVLGGGIDYKLNIGSWYFQAWKEENTNILLPIEGYFESKKSTALTAEVTSAVKKKMVTINFMNGESEIISNDLENAISITPSYESMKVEGSSVEVVVVESGWYALNFKDEIKLSNDTALFFNSASGDTLKFENGEYTLFVNSDITVNVDYGTGGRKTVTIDFADDSDRTKGEISIGDNSSVTSSTPISYEGDRLGKVVISAIAYNGWSFVGWYRDVAGYANLFSDDPIVTITITANMNLYAKFVKNLNAIYEWEGSSEKKMMIWRSKTYVASKPFNPSACRIDSTRYPIPVLSFEQFSSPDSAPTAKATLTNIQSQKARRLPVRRTEKYLQAYVEHDDEVDAILVGTSMEGLAI